LNDKIIHEQHTPYRKRPSTARCLQDTLCDEYRVIFVASSGQVPMAPALEQRHVALGDHNIVDRNAVGTRHTQIRRVTS
jgi:hypothetical protein